MANEENVQRHVKGATLSYAELSALGASLESSLILVKSDYAKGKASKTEVTEVVGILLLGFGAMLRLESAVGLPDPLRPSRRAGLKALEFYEELVPPKNAKPDKAPNQT